MFLFTKGEILIFLAISLSLTGLLHLETEKGGIGFCFIWFKEVKILLIFNDDWKGVRGGSTPKEYLWCKEGSLNGGFLTLEKDCWLVKQFFGLPYSELSYSGEICLYIE